MSASEPVCKPSTACPVMEAAGTIIRRRDVAGFSLREVCYAAGVSLPLHCHDEPYLTLVLSGAYSERYAHREYEWGEGAINVVPAGVGHENQFPTAARLLRVTIEPGVIERLGKERTEWLSAPREISGPLCTWLAHRIVREFVAQDDLAALAMEGVLLEMLAESARSSDETHGSSAPAWLKRVRESLEDQYLHAPSLPELAASGGVHPVHLSREFHKHYGITVGEYIRKRRIEHASELLANSDVPMTEIAETCGFSDQSHFCSVFKKHSGMTPAKFRDLSGRSRARPAKLLS